MPPDLVLYMINTQKLKFTLSRTFFHGPKGDRAIEVLLYVGPFMYDEVFVTKLNHISRSSYVIGIPCHYSKVNRKAMIRNKYSHIPHHTLNTTRERRTNTKFDQRQRKTRTVNGMNSSFPNRWSFSYPN